MKATPSEARAVLPDMAADQLIAGAWVVGTGTVIDVTDKYSLVPFARLGCADAAQVDQTVGAALAAFEKNTLSAYDRGAVLDRTAKLVEQRLDQFVGAMQREAGFPRDDAARETRRCLETLRLCAEEARRLTGETVPLEGAPQQAGRIGFTLRIPLGVVAAITPFNAPLNTVAHKVGPAFAAGNAVILKPSTHTPFTARLLVQAFADAGAPAGLVSLLHGDGTVVEHLLKDQRVRFYAFTGSTEVGRKIQREAGLRRTQMELGSIAFTILCEDADLDVALPKIVSAGYRKAGQVCTSVQLLLVHASRMREVGERMRPLVQALVYGDPADSSTVVGPVISEAAARRIEDWIGEAMKGGATRLVGGPRQGAVIPPTLLTGLDERMRVSCQEIFGPVVCLKAFDDLDDAIAQVNATPYGLATGIFTNRLDQALNAARRLQVGGVHINETSSSRVDLMPYGGTKDSGFGREGPSHAIREMSEERIVTFTS